jgi:hypothetical protein
MRPTLSRPLVLLLLLVSLAFPGCRTPPLELDEPRIAAEIEQRSAKAVATPEVDKGFDALIEGAFAEPSVGDAGKALLTALGDDPGLKPGFEAVMGAIGAHPTIKALVLKIMKENPKASPDRIGEIAGERVGAITEGPLFEQAFGRAFHDLLARPNVAAVFNRLGEKVANDKAMTATIANAVKTRVNDEKWRARLTALNGGQMPDKARATDLFLDSAMSEARLAKVYIDLAALPVMKREIALAARDIAAAPAFEKHAAAAVKKCVDDAGIRARIVDAMALLMGEGATEQKLFEAFHAILTAPVVESSLTTLIDDMMSDPSLGAIGQRTITAIAADPAFQSTLSSLVEGW